MTSPDDLDRDERFARINGNPIPEMHACLLRDTPLVTSDRARLEEAFVELWHALDEAQCLAERACGNGPENRRRLDAIHAGRWRAAALALPDEMTDGELAAERHYLSLGGGITWPARDVARFFATIDALKARALPAPRRYTGGPLEDGLYLWRPALWGAGLRDWASIDTSTLTGRYDIKEIVEAEAAIWLIGPIPIPDLPEEET